MPKSIQQLIDKQLQEFEKEFCHWDGEKYVDSLGIKSFLTHSIELAYEEGRKEKTMKSTKECCKKCESVFRIPMAVSFDCSEGGHCHMNSCMGIKKDSCSYGNCINHKSPKGHRCECLCKPCNCSCHTPQPPQESEWEERLDKWLETNEHKYSCIGYSEGQYCCLDRVNVEKKGYTYGELGRNKLREIVNKTLASQKKSLLEEIRGKVENEIIEWEKGDYHTNIAGGAISALRTFLSKLNDLLKELK